MKCGFYYFYNISTTLKFWAARPLENKNFLNLFLLLFVEPLNDKICLKNLMKSRFDFFDNLYNISILGHWAAGQLGRKLHKNDKIKMFSLENKNFLYAFFFCFV
jgi:hypothetical protein